MSHGQATRSTRGCSRVIHFTRFYRSLRLRAEDHEGAEREHAEEREEGCGNRWPSPRDIPPRHRDWRKQADDDHEPEQDPDPEDFADRAGYRERDQEDRYEHDLKDHEVAISDLEPVRGVGVDVTAGASQEKEQSCRAGEGRREEHPAECQSRVAPDRL